MAERGEAGDVPIGTRAREARSSRRRRALGVAAVLALMTAGQIAVLPVADAVGAAGDLDISWGNDGVGRAQAGWNTYARDYAEDIVRDPATGRIAVLASSSSAGGSSGPVISVAMLTAAGDLDLTFSDDGKTTFDPTPSNESARGGVFDSLGRLVIAGALSSSGSWSDGREFVMRVLPSGALDASFGDSGMALEPQPPAGESFAPSGVDVDSADRVITTGNWMLPPVTVGATTTYPADGYVRRYTADGGVDTSFGTATAPGTTGVAVLDRTTLRDVEISGAQIYVSGTTSETSSGTTSYDAIIGRLDASGAFDGAWSGDGIAQLTGATSAGTTITVTGPSQFDAIDVDATGRVYATGGGVFSNGIWISRFDSFGIPDATYGGGDGAAEIPISAYDRSMSSIDALADGSAIVSGYTNHLAVVLWEVVIVRVDNDGEVDAAFGGGDGIATTTRPATNPGDFEERSVGGVIDGGGSYWTVSFADGAYAATGDEDAFLRRWDATTGELDTTYFGGARSFDFGRDVPAAGDTFGMAAAEDGRVAIVGYSSPSGYADDVAVGMLEPSGNPDPSFGTGGGTIIDLDTNSDYAMDATFTSDGGLVVAADANGDAAFIKLSPTGDLDPSFGNGGKAVLGGSGYQAPFSVEAVPGAVVAALDLDGPFTVFKLTDGGEPDLAFGTDGKASVPLVAPWTTDSLDADATTNRVAVTGRTFGDTFGVAVFDLATGDLDPTFNGGAVADLEVPGATSIANPQSVAIAADGSVVVAGSTTVDGALTQVAIRWTAAGVPDAAFGVGGVKTWNTGAMFSQLWAEGVDIDAEGRTLVASSGWTSNFAMTLWITRLTAQGELDTSFGTNGTTALNPSLQPRAAGLAISGTGVVAGVTGAGLTAVRVLNEPMATTDTTPPTINVTSPAEGATYAVGESVNAAYSCADETLLASCVGTVASGAAIATSTPGSKTFVVNTTDAAGNPASLTVNYTVQWDVTETVAAGESVSAGTATAGDPYAVEVVTSAAAGGEVSIVIDPEGSTVPTGYEVLGAAIDITAPPGSVGDPLEITFRLDASVLIAESVTWDEVQILRDGVPLGSCATNPVPCIVSQDEVDGDAVIVVSTDHASVWQTVKRQEFDESGFFSPVDNTPLLNTMKAGGAVPVKFSLDGYQGLNVFAAGSPSSQRVPCDDEVVTDQIEQTVSAGSSSLTYDATTDRYTYVWKTQKAWSGTCRELTVKFADGQQLTARFKLTK